MSAATVRILNFDDSLLAQRNLLARVPSVIVDLKTLGPSARGWVNPKTAQAIRAKLTPELMHAPTLYGSGDFHHISSLLIDQFTEPITVVVFDHHPDWDMMPPRVGYGSWITHILRRWNIAQVIVLGPSSADLSTGRIQTGHLQALKDGRLEIYPFVHAPTRVVGRNVPTSRCADVRRGLFFQEMRWRELHLTDLRIFCAGLFSHLRTRKVYVTIDKDCLTSSYALTNWEDGFLSLNHLSVMLEELRRRTEIVGLDITGDYSPVITGFLKSLYLRWDHPRYYSARGQSPQAIQAINEKTNLHILGILGYC